MADDSFEEPFDSSGPTVRSSLTTNGSSIPNAPPSFAFGHGASSSSLPPSGGGGPPAAAFATTMDMDDDEKTVRAGGARVRLSDPSPLLVPSSSDLNERWKEYETPSLYSVDNKQGQSISSNIDLTNPRQQPYPVPRATSSYATEELIRKYGGMAGLSAGVAAAGPPPPSTVSPRRVGSPPSSSASTSRSPADVRDQALKMLELVDDYNIRRTESGGFRASFAATPVTPDNDVATPFSFRRGGSMAASGKRVPSALSGLNFSTTKSSTNKPSGRASFTDPSFRDDNQISDDDDEEDNILRPDGGFHDESVVDMVGMEHRAAGMRASDLDDKSFEGDFQGGSKTWSSRYTDNPYVSRAHVLDQWDREFEQDHQKGGRKSARNMFMSTASDIRSSATNVWKGASDQKQKIFGTGAFTFRSNHVFGNHRGAASERDEVHLRAAWRDVDDVVNVPSAHKTWQEVMLNKKRRRRVLYALGCLFLGIIITATTLKAVQSARAGESSMAGLNIGQTVTFYVTSDTPYDAAAEARLQKDLINLPMDTEFVIHLGNIQEAAVSMCPKARYAEVGSLLQKSPVPLFILPGAEDWAKCPDPASRMDKWLATFKDFDLKFKHSIDVKRDVLNPETFSFVYKGVLFMGLHIVSGPVMDEDAWRNREKEMLKFYFGMANANKGTFRYIVLLGNARPSPQQKDFFDALLSNLKSHHGPLMYIHANQKGDEVLQYNPFAKDHNDVTVIGIQDGSSHPPLKIKAGFGARPLVIG